MDYFLSVQETAKLLRTTPARIYVDIYKKEIPENLFCRFRRKILFKKQELINWIESGAAA